MSCKIIKAILDTVSTAISTAAIRTKPSDEPSSKPSSMPSLQPLLQPSSELPTMPISKPSGEPSSKPSSTPYIQPLSQPSSKPSIKPSSKPSDASSKQSSTKLLEGLASLGSSLDLSLGSLGMFGLSLESPGGGQSQSYVRSLGWNNHGSYHKGGEDSNYWLKRRRKSCWKGWRGLDRRWNGPKGLLE
jgi:hypothetical protein